LRLALAHGVNHLDIAPQYGAAESVVGPNLAAVRDEIFVAGKTLRANPEGVQDQFDNTRRLLNADVLDLYRPTPSLRSKSSTAGHPRSRRSSRCAKPATPALRGSRGTTSRCRAPISRRSGASISTP
ncbi:MAG TPA: aldo/keto reductase, partial [Acidimicrobiia bacterium]|nr:aldo/keto reductase [Acidimicrobiia bacterium]